MDNINENGYREHVKYNSDGTVNVPFGRTVEWYINSVPMLKVCRLKHQSRQKTSQLVKEGLIEVKHTTDAIDFLEWKTKHGDIRSTNRIDNIIILTPEGEELLKKIRLGLIKDKNVYTVLVIKGNLKNANDMHLCNVRVILECQLSWLNSSTPLKITIKGFHVPHNFPVTQLPQVTSKMLASLNGTSEENIRETLNNQQKVCSDGKLRKLITRDDRCLKDNVGPWTILHNMIKKILKPNGFVLYYQMANPNEPEDSPARYYQLTVSDEFWLRNRRDFGKICVGLDGKYDPNIDRAPVLSIVVENNAGCRTPLAFALSNKENHVTIHTAISAIKQNILCNDNNCEHHWYYEDLSDENGFRRIHPCSQNNLWNPYIIIDKHRPSKLGVDGLTRCVILCWFHIIQTLGNNFKEWQIPQQFRYPIAMAFKIIG
ncbi:hypothetical protein GLOIN_2v1542684 [Rhizophagus clarus]|uniref:Uncharacterized protein n=1 Tax=Rhizophagus clarus TaxID=94130 RepID=A0A8H3L716_9GLOM|nr:hypothetical protein GLOIN_2v1542684 [Rhizophagus clarus]